MRNIKRITEVMKIWNCKRALGLLKQIYRENLFSAVLSLIVIILLAVVGVMPSFLIGKIIDMAAAGRIDGLFMLNVGLILALGGGKILEIVQEYITAESTIVGLSVDASHVNTGLPNAKQIITSTVVIPVAITTA